MAYENIFLKTQAMADIAGFYRAYELEVADTNTDRVDFLPTELEYMSYLTLKEAYAIEQAESEHFEVCRDSQRKFLQDHLGRWVKIFSEILHLSTESPFYLQAGTLLHRFVDSEISELGAAPAELANPPKPSSVNEPFGCDGCLPQS